MTSKSTTDSAAVRMRRSRRRLSWLLCLGFLLPADMTAGAKVPDPPATASLDFERYEVDTGATRRQTVLPGFFLGGEMADLAALHIDENGGRRLRLYGFDDGSWQPALEAKLHPHVRFVDLIDIGGRDRLITFANGRLSWFDPQAASERTLLKVAMSYDMAHDGVGSPNQPGSEIPRVDISHDLNADGRDDLVIPDTDGFWISTQTSDGSFPEAVKLGPAEPFLDQAQVDEKRRYGEVGLTAVTIPWYLSRIHQLDYDQDGRVDLAFWNEDHFDVHLQNELGQFDPVAETFRVDVPFDADGSYSLLFGHDDRNSLSLLLGWGKSLDRSMLRTFRDLNGDQVADLIVQKTRGRSMLKLRSSFEVHFGTPTPHGLTFGKAVDLVIAPHGRAGGIEASGYASQLFGDFDGDGLTDIMFRDVNTGLGGMFRAMVGNSVGIDLELYRGDAGNDPETPTVRRRIRRFAPFAGIGNIFFPPVLMGDVNGDGRADLVVGHSPKELRVFLGVPGPDLLARRPQKVAVALPPDERHTRLVDLNGDGKLDLLVHNGPTGRAPDRPHRLTLLITRVGDQRVEPAIPASQLTAHGMMTTLPRALSCL